MMDEEIYSSIIARYLVLSARYGTNSQFEQIFRCHKAASNNIIPNHLSIMSNQLSQLNSVEKILNKHTLFTLYAHFIKHDVVNKIMNEIYNDESRRAFMRLGLIAKGVYKENKVVRICPVCNKTDLEILGFNYIHRIHEVEFLSVCPFHKVKLVTYKARSKYSYRNLIDFSFEDIEGVELKQANNEVELELSFLANEIINVPIDSKVFLEEIIQAYREHLMMKGYLAQSQKIRLNRIKTDMSKYYSNTGFESLFYELNDRLSDKWIGRVFRSDRLISPLYHLVMINFLASSFSNFMAMSDLNLKFSKPPWPCLNPVCPEYLARVIYDCQTYWSGTRLVMKVHHSCGFSYLKYSDSLNSKNIYAYDRVSTYGDKWLKRLNYYVHNTNLPTKVISRNLHCDSKTVINFINSLEIE